MSLGGNIFTNAVYKMIIFNVISITVLVFSF